MAWTRSQADGATDRSGRHRPVLGLAEGLGGTLDPSAATSAGMSTHLAVSSVVKALGNGLRR